MRRRAAQLDAQNEALAKLADYASDTLDVLTDVRDQLAEINANTAPREGVETSR
jgi:hypothetical protein